MSKETFGSPDAKDASARYDRIVNNATATFMKMLAQSAGVMNRPLGSETLSAQKQKEVYAMVRGDPQALMNELGNFIQVAGNPVTGAKNWSQWVLDMEKQNGTTSD